MFALRKSCRACLLSLAAVAACLILSPSFCCDGPLSPAGRSGGFGVAAAEATPRRAGKRSRHNNNWAVLVSWSWWWCDRFGAGHGMGAVFSLVESNTNRENVRDYVRICKDPLNFI